MGAGGGGGGGGGGGVSQGPVTGFIMFLKVLQALIRILRDVAPLSYRHVCYELLKTLLTRVAVDLNSIG